MSGWKMVPVEPTAEMIRAGWHCLREKNDIQTRLGNSLAGTETPVYRAMLATAPAPPFDEAAERSAFETYYRGTSNYCDDNDFAIGGDSEYKAMFVEFRWKPWLACARLKAGQPS